MPASVLSDFNKTNYELHLPMVLSMMKACALIVKGLNLSFFFSYNSVPTLHSKMGKLSTIIFTIIFY